MNITYSDHAIARMDARNIGKPTVNAVVHSGEVEKVEPSGVCRLRLCDVVVVMDCQNVVTVFEDSDSKCKSNWSPKKRQRAGQREHKSTFVKGRHRKLNLSLSESYLRQAIGG